MIADPIKLFTIPMLVIAIVVTGILWVNRHYHFMDGVDAGYFVTISLMITLLVSVIRLRAAWALEEKLREQKRVVDILRGD